MGRFTPNTKATEHLGIIRVTRNFQEIRCRKRKQNKIKQKQTNKQTKKQQKYGKPRKLRVLHRYLWSSLDSMQSAYLFFLFRYWMAIKNGSSVVVWFKKMDLTELCEVGQISRCLHFSLTSLFLSHPSPQYYKPSSFTRINFEFQSDILEQRACTVCFALKKVQENTWIMFFFRCTHLTEWSIKWHTTPVSLPEKSHGQRSGCLYSLGLPKV